MYDVSILELFGLDTSLALLITAVISLAVIPVVKYIKSYNIPKWIPIPVLSVVIAGLFLWTALYLNPVIMFMVIIGLVASGIVDVTNVLGKVKE